MDFLNNINYQLGNAIGLTLLDPQHFISLVMRFVINLIVVTIIARFFYYPRSLRRDYMFIFILMSLSGMPVMCGIGSLMLNSIASTLFDTR